MKSMCIKGHHYQIYEFGRGHILISKDGRVHIKFAPRPSGCLCFYIWQDHRWKPKYKYDSVPYESVLDQDKILQFMFNNPITN